MKPYFPVFYLKKMEIIVMNCIKYYLYRLCSMIKIDFIVEANSSKTCINYSII